MRNFWALPALLRVALASQHGFSVHDDVLAFPQYEIVFEKDHVSEYQAHARMVSNEGLDKDFGTDSSESDVALRQETPGGGIDSAGKPREKEQFEYDILSLEGQRYLCRIPQVDQSAWEDANSTVSKSDEEKELERANDRGWALLKGMQGNCIYFLSGWWSYRYCHGEGVKQFHRLPPSQGIPAYPPIEDTSVTGFILGQNEAAPPEEKGVQDRKAVDGEGAGKALGQLEIRGDTRYLVQKLGGGTQCDLTGKDRRVEVQFHCNPATSDRISLIKEVATCAYLMVIQTPRLCNDVAFLPPQKDHPNLVSCSPILSAADVPAYESALEAASARAGVASQFPNPFEHAGQSKMRPNVGGIEVGAHRYIPEGFKIEKSAILGGGKEIYIETIADSSGKVLPAEQLKKLGLGDPKTVQKLKDRLDEMAGDRGWKLEVYDTPRGREYRGITGLDEEEEEEEEGEREASQGEQVKGAPKKDTTTAKEDQQQEGTEETYKQRDEL